MLGRCNTNSSPEVLYVLFIDVAFGPNQGPEHCTGFDQPRSLFNKGLLYSRKGRQGPCKSSTDECRSLRRCVPRVDGCKLLVHAMPYSQLSMAWGRQDSSHRISTLGLFAELAYCCISVAFKNLNRHWLPAYARLQTSFEIS